MDSMGVKVTIVLAWTKGSIFLGDKEKGEACGDFNRTMRPVLRCSLTNVAQVSFSLGLRGYTLVILGTNVSFRSMV